jgi:hypothetical protein
MVVFMSIQRVYDLASNFSYSLFLIFSSSSFQGLDAQPSMGIGSSRRKAYYIRTRTFLVNIRIAIHPKLTLLHKEAFRI